CALALDGRGVPHLTHYDLERRRLSYSTLDALRLQWVTEVVDERGDVGRYHQLVLDGAGVPHAVYFDASDTRLKHARRGSSGWTAGVVDQEGHRGFHAHAVREANGQLLAVYSNEGAAKSNGPMKVHFARYDGSSWSLEGAVLDGHGPYRLQPGRDGAVHLLHLVDTRLAYSVRRDGKWRTEILTTHRPVLPNFNAAFALDGQDRPHVTYYDADDGALRLLQ
ncbi:MAG: hypothetical protein ACK4N5_13435, partial [Myxococcales bacterium]